MTAPPPLATLPELGSLLGRLVAPPGVKAPVEAALDGLRLDLLSQLFERAAAARKLLSAGDELGMRAALGRTTWLEAWDRAITRATAVLLGEIEQRVRDAATRSRYPAKRLAGVLPDSEERRLLGGRLSAAGIGLEEAVERLESARAWNEALHRVAGELEVAWERLIAIAREELAAWDARAAAVRAWRRPWRPLVLVGIALLSLATWFGLVLGGYLPVPGWLRPFAEWVWNL